MPSDESKDDETMICPVCTFDMQDGAVQNGDADYDPTLRCANVDCVHFGESAADIRAALAPCASVEGSGSEPLTASADAATIRARFAELLENMPAHYDEPGIWDEASVAVVLVREALAAPAPREAGEPTDAQMEAALLAYQGWGEKMREGVRFAIKHGDSHALAMRAALTAALAAPPAAPEVTEAMCKEAAREFSVRFGLPMDENAWTDEDTQDWTHILTAALRGGAR